MVDNNDLSRRLGHCEIARIPSRSIFIPEYAYEEAEWQLLFFGYRATFRSLSSRFLFLCFCFWWFVYRSCIGMNSSGSEPNAVSLIFLNRGKVLHCGCMIRNSAKRISQEY